MRPDQFVDAVQTIGIVAIAAILAYVVARLERALDVGAEKIKAVLANQRETLDSFNKVWSRITEIENRQGIRTDFVPPAELRATLATLAQRLDRLEADYADHASIDH